METAVQDLFHMFYPLSQAQRRRWAQVVSSPEAEYRSALEREAHDRGLQQRTAENAVIWLDQKGQELLLLFRVEDPRDLNAVQDVYRSIAGHQAPLAYTFVHQLPDGQGTWDVFHMSKLSYLAHCNRFAGPGAGAEQ